MITTEKIMLQLSLCEGFEVRVSEAIEYGKSGFLVDVGENDSVANHRFDLYTYEDLYIKVSRHAKTSLRDEDGTVGNAPD
ncbi:hypothetical protein HOY82DRAFT_609569 [Tuber indicum]|nr:hypothetical protein HOY82DRAFT_609569 [Tuber indicum]